MNSATTLLSLLAALLLTAGCSRRDDAEWRHWARWGMTDAQVHVASNGRAPLAQLEEQGHIAIFEADLEARAPLRQNGILFDGSLWFDARTRRLHSVGLRLQGAKPCADLIDETLKRNRPPDGRYGAIVGRSGLYVWEGRPFDAGFKLSYPYSPERGHRCALTYSAPGYKPKRY